MRTSTNYLFSALIIGMISLSSRVEGQAPNREELAAIREATRDLAREVELLQEVLGEQAGDKERNLYQQADAVHARIMEFRTSLTVDKTFEHRVGTFDKLDREIHEFLKAVEVRGSDQRLLQRLASRVRAADDELHYALLSKATSTGTSKQLLERQTRALVTAARQLDRVAGFTLGNVQGKAVLVADLHKLAEAAEHFQEGFAGLDRSQQLKGFAMLTQAWERATRGLEDLKGSTSTHLIRAAGQFDQFHERLHHLLGVKGDRPQLILRT